MNICLIIEENNKLLWKTTLCKLHTLGFRWYRIEGPLNEFSHLDDMLKAGAKGLGVNFKDKKVVWTSMPIRHYGYFIKVIK